MRLNSMISGALCVAGTVVTTPVISSLVITTVTKHATVTDHVTDHVTVVDHITAAVCTAQAPSLASSGPLIGDDKSPGHDIEVSGTSSPTKGDSGGGYSMVNAAGYTITAATTWTGLASGQTAPTLKPAVPFNHDSGKIEHLSPSDNCALHYTHSDVDNQAGKQIFASMNATFAYPAVVLHHSSLVSSIACTGSGLSLQLTSLEALNYCKENWASSKIVLVSTACGADGDGHNAYFLVYGVSYDASTLTAHCKATEVEIPDCMTNVELTWGTITPNSPANHSTSSSSTDHDGNNASPGSPSTSSSSTAHDGNGASSHGPSNNSPTDTTAISVAFPTDTDATSVASPTDTDVTSVVSPTNTDVTSVVSPTNTDVISIVSPTDTDASSVASPTDTDVSSVVSPTDTDVTSVASPTDTEVTSVASPTDTEVTSVASCGVPPAATISGFPAAPCGDNFDRLLDDMLGYVDFSVADFSSSLADVAPGLSDDSISDFDEDDVSGGVLPISSSASRRATGRQSFVERRAAHIQKRFFFTTFIQKVADAVVNTVKEAPRAIANAVASAAQTGYNFVKDTVSSLLNPSVDASTNFDIGPKTLSDSVFGQAYPLYHIDKSSGAVSGSIDFYCVDCQVKGFIHVAGKVSFSIVSASITEGYIECDGNMLAQANLGIAAQATYQPDPFKKNIAAQGFPILTIPKVIVVGPEFSLDASLGVSIEANGQVLVGASASLPNFAARLDLVDSSKTSATGFTPVFNTRFDAQVGITVSSKLAFPIQVGVGIDLIPLGTKGRRLISVINEPSVSLRAEYSTAGECANGVAYNIALADDTSLDFFQLRTVSLATFTSPNLVSGCKQFGSGGNSIRGDDSTSSGSSDGSITPAEVFRRQDDTIIDSSDDSNGDATQYDLVYTAVVDQSGSYVLINDDDGNLGLAQGDGSSDPNTAAANALSIPGAAYGSYEQVVASDDSDRIFHYYPDTMAAFGVSRIRLSSIDAIPTGADLLDLVPVNYDDSSSTPGVYMAVDTMGRYFYTIACNIEGDAAKIFIASDPDVGAAKLADPDLRYIVTGGVVQDCSFIPFFSPGAGLS